MIEEEMIIDFTNIQEGAELGRLGAKIKRMFFYMHLPILVLSPIKKEASYLMAFLTK